MSFTLLDRPLLPALLRGFARRCPSCGTGRMFEGLLRVRDHCPTCGEALHHQRADDAPPYFTVLIVAHIVVPMALITEQTAHPSQWLHMAVWIPLTLALTFALLPRIKGALVALQWSQRMHGFGGRPDD